MWSRDGGELFFVSLRDEPVLRLMVAAVETGSRFSAGDPRPLFEFERGVLGLTAPLRNYDVASDGRRFVFVRSIESTAPAVREIQLVLNWDRELERLAP